MLTYQLRPRTLRILGKRPPQFPADVVIHFYFQPLQAFGESRTGGRTVVQHTAPRIVWNANNGQSWADNAGALKPLEIRTDSGSLDLRGATFTRRVHCENAEALRQIVDATCFILPALLCVEFADPPFVERVEGTIGDVPFRWELASITAGALITTQEALETAFATALDDLALVGAPHRRRLLAALGYFHSGCRLLREAKTAGEFMSESILNFSKVIEVLYGTASDTVKVALKELGYKREEIERDFLPILDMRNSLDVGHPALALLTVEQLATIHWFADRCERVMTELLKRLLAAIRSGSLDVKARVAGAPDATTRRVLDRLTEIRKAHPDL